MYRKNRRILYEYCNSLSVYDSVLLFIIIYILLIQGKAHLILFGNN